MTKLLDLFSYRIVTNEALVSKVKQVEKIRLRLEARGIFIRPINLKKFEAEVSGIREVYNTAFEENWGFLPLDEQEFYDYACNLRRITPAEMMLVAEKDGKIIGFICNVPDINQVLTVIKNGKLFPFGIMPWIYRKRLIDQIRVLILGVAREYRNQGVDLCLYAGTFLNGTRLGYRLAEAAYVMENNEQMTRILEALGAEPVKSYRLFSRNLSRD